MAAWLKLVPSWAWWALALLVVGGVQQLRVAGAQVEAAGAGAELAGYKTEVSDRDRRSTLAALQETKRRMAAINEVDTNATKELEVARTDLANAGSALERLQQRLEAAEQRSRAAGNTITAQLSQAAEADSRVRTELLGRLGTLAQLYAGAADESRIAGQACVRAYESLGGG